MCSIERILSSKSGPRQCHREQGGDGRGQTTAGLLHEEKLHQRVWGVKHAHHEGWILVSAQVFVSGMSFPLWRGLRSSEGFTLHKEVPPNICH